MREVRLKKLVFVGSGKLCWDTYLYLIAITSPLILFQVSILPSLTSQRLVNYSMHPSFPSYPPYAPPPAPYLHHRPHVFDTSFSPSPSRSLNAEPRALISGVHVRAVDAFVAAWEGRSRTRYRRGRGPQCRQRCRLQLRRGAWIISGGMQHLTLVQRCLVLASRWKHC